MIAQKPIAQRDRSKLTFFAQGSTGELSHHQFYELVDFLSSSDILVLNNTEVIPARLLGKKDTGGKAELLILKLSRRRVNSKKCACEMVCLKVSN